MHNVSSIWMKLFKFTANCRFYRISFSVEIPPFRAVLFVSSCVLEHQHRKHIKRRLFCACVPYWSKCRLKPTTGFQTAFPSIFPLSAEQVGDIFHLFFGKTVFAQSGGNCPFARQTVFRTELPPFFDFGFVCGFFGQRFDGNPAFWDGIHRFAPNRWNSREDTVSVRASSACRIGA